MRKFSLLLFSLFFFSNAFSQNKLANSKIHAKETEITLYYLRDNKSGMIVRGRDNLGVQVIRRFPLKKHTKVGLGALIAADYNEFESDIFPYGALFGDVTQFIGRRQKWSIGTQLGYGFYHRKYESYNSVSKSYSKYSGGLDLSFSVGYRAIVSKKSLLIISPYCNFRHLHWKAATEYYSPPSIQKASETEEHSGFGLKVGVVL